MKMGMFWLWVDWCFTYTQGGNSLQELLREDSCVIKATGCVRDGMAAMVQTNKRRRKTKRRDLSTYPQREQWKTPAMRYQYSTEYIIYTAYMQHARYIDKHDLLLNIYIYVFYIYAVCKIYIYDLLLVVTWCILRNMVHMYMI